MRRLLAVFLLCALPFAAGADVAPAVVEHLAASLRIPTVSFQDRERMDAAAFEGFLAFLGETYPSVFATLETERVNDYSLLMRWPGRDATLEAVLFDAHYDVVPIEPGTEGDWTHPPYDGVIADGFVWGRGALDDKAAVIVTLDALASLISDGYAPERTLYFSFVHDEEIGGEEGAGAVAALLRDRGVRIAYVVGEGGGITSDFPLLPGLPVATIALAEKSYLTLTLSSTGTGGHSSMPPPDSAIVSLAKALAKLHENPFDARLAPPVDSMLMAIGEHRGGPMGFALRNLWLTEAIVTSQLAADPVGSALVRTTTAVTMIDAGVKENVVPQRAEARVNFRVLPDERIEDVIAAVEALIDDPSIEVTSQPWAGNPGVSDVQGEGYARVRAAIEAAVPDVAVIPGMLMATTDSRHYAELAPVYRFHPMIGSIDEMRGVHGTDERVRTESLEQGVAIYRELVERVGAR